MLIAFRSGKCQLFRGFVATFAGFLASSLLQEAGSAFTLYTAASRERSSFFGSFTRVLMG